MAPEEANTIARDLLYRFKLNPKVGILFFGMFHVIDVKAAIIPKVTI